MNQTKQRSLFVALVAPIVATITQFVPAEAIEKPNIVLIMADDMGYEALSVNGSESCESPNLDKLAAEGLFVSRTVSPIRLCTPSRAKIMTGQYNVAELHQIRHVLDREQTTFAHQLKAVGYATCIAGKWQLGRKQTDSPQHFGFDQSCLWQHTRSGRSNENGRKTIDQAIRQPAVGNQRYRTRLQRTVNMVRSSCTEFICDFIESNSGKSVFDLLPDDTHALPIRSDARLQLTGTPTAWAQPPTKATAMTRSGIFATWSPMPTRLSDRLWRSLRSPVSARIRC